jgi:hypothetical protein
MYMDKNLRNALNKVQTAYPEAIFTREQNLWRIVADDGNGGALSGLHDTMDDALFDAAFALPGPYTPPPATVRPSLLRRAWNALVDRLRSPLTPTRSFFHR